MVHVYTPEPLLYLIHLPKSASKQRSGPLGIIQYIFSSGKQLRKGAHVRLLTANRVMGANLDISGENKAELFQHLGPFLDKFTMLSGGACKKIGANYQYIQRFIACSTSLSQCCVCCSKYTSCCYSRVIDVLNWNRLNV